MAPRITLITGCSSGIGLSTAVMLAKDSSKGGYIVYATMRNLGKKGELEAAAGSTLNKNLFILELDVTKFDTITSVLDTITKKHGRLDVLINNAAVGSIGFVEHIEFDQIRQLFETNFFGVVKTIQEVIPIMKKQKSGHIISISSAAGTHGVPFLDIYNASKFALEGFSESIASSLRYFNIWVSTVQPGPVKTKFTDNYGPNNQPGFDQVNNENVDKVTRSLLKKMVEGFSSAPEYSEVQTGEDIGKVVQTALTDSPPHFQYPTSKCRADHAAQKYVDPRNDANVNYYAALINPDK